jgi:hypothetical protein
MANAERNNITLVVYYRSTQPVSTLSLSTEDASLAWLMDSLEVIPCGTYYCLRLLPPGVQARPPHSSGHWPSEPEPAIQGVLRKKAIKRIASAVPETAPQETYIQHPPFAARTATGTTFRLNWIKSIFQLTLNGL